MPRFTRAVDPRRNRTSPLLGVRFRGADAIEIDRACLASCEHWDPPCRATAFSSPRRPFCGCCPAGYPITAATTMPKHGYGMRCLISGIERWGVATDSRARRPLACSRP
jgi:hypothetical protein